MDRKHKILVVEDEIAICTGLVDVLVFHGHDVSFSHRGDEGLKLALSGKFDLVLLDVMLPAVDGFEICRRIREADKEQAIIMLTAKTQDEDIINGLKLGADDYVAKPFSVAQLVLRVEAVLRRSNRLQKEARQICVGNLTIDTQNLIGERGHTKIEFTRREVDLLSFLMVNNHRPVSREELLNKVWGYNEGADIETRTVDIHVAKLRRKIELDNQSPVFLVTVRGEGYRLLADA